MIPTTLKCPKCGRQMVVKDGLDGCFCSSSECGYYSQHAPPDDAIIKDIKQIFSEERVKHLRGVPMNTVTLGSESLGRISVQIPCDASRAEQEMIIDNAMQGLKHAIEYANANNMNIFSQRSKKVE